MSQFTIPPDVHSLDRTWWAPLEAVARVIAGRARYRFFDLADIMLMAKIVRRPPRADIVLYKHYYTRRYLNLDGSGHAYRYVPARSLERGTDRYLRHRDLIAALDALDLWELPWMKASLEHHRDGLSWDDRWQIHPDLDDRRDPGRGRLRVV